MANEDSLIAPPYEIVSVQKTHPPPGAEGSRWYRYTIVQGDNTIHGCRKGSLRAVTSAVETIVAQLNERQTGKRGRVQLVTKSTTKINK
jgi:hypothetical protein